MMATTVRAGALEYRITPRDGALRVSLSGVLERVSLEDLIRRNAEALGGTAHEQADQLYAHTLEVLDAETQYGR